MREVAPRTTSVSEDAERCCPGHDPHSTAVACARRPSWAFMWSMRSRPSSTSGSSCRSCMCEMASCCSFARLCTARIMARSVDFADRSARSRTRAADPANRSITVCIAWP
ncbi:Uncharacterised protein [Mycobacterium tuberculosis]|nr:Uncharacterised protein [Mycobacterium tuberculosis]